MSRKTTPEPYDPADPVNIVAESVRLAGLTVALESLKNNRPAGMPVDLQNYAVVIGLVTAAACGLVASTTERNPNVLRNSLVACVRLAVDQALGIDKDAQANGPGEWFSEH